MPRRFNLTPSLQARIDDGGSFSGTPPPLLTEIPEMAIIKGLSTIPQERVRMESVDKREFSVVLSVAEGAGEVSAREELQRIRDSQDVTVGMTWLEFLAWFQES